MLSMEDKTVLEKDTEKMAYNNKQSVMKGIEIAGFDYLRDVDGKLMVIECFCENDENGIATSYINRFMKNS